MAWSSAFFPHFDPQSSQRFGTGPVSITVIQSATCWQFYYRNAAVLEVNDRSTGH